MNGLFRDRIHAGQVLAPKLRTYAHRSDVLVLALPRGGVPVAAEVARKLRAPLDVLVVRKLGVPGQEELAFGALANGVVYLDQAMIGALQIDAATVAAVSTRESTELRRRERAYRGDRPFPDLSGRTVILIDDGIATGSCMRAAVRSVESHHAAAIVVAAPVASHEAVEALRTEAQVIITVLTAERLFAIGDYYRDFRQTTDDEVKRLLAGSTESTPEKESAA